MVKAAPKSGLSGARDIPLDLIDLSQSNVRRVKAGVSIEALADDIARHGLLPSLNLRPTLDDQGQETGRFHLPAVGRRFHALEIGRAACREGVCQYAEISVVAVT